VVDESPLAVDLDDRQPLAVAGLELRVAADIDLFELELVLLPKPRERVQGTLAEMTAFGVVDDDPTDRGPAS
jgi:hypothetical protein